MNQQTQPKHHLVILRKPYLAAILAGSKTIESRFSKYQPQAFTHVRPGDKLFLKESSGPVRATAAVKIVKRFTNLTPQKIQQLKLLHNKQIQGSDQYWQSKADSRFGLLVWLDTVQPINPVRINKRDWRAWLVLTEKENFGLLAPPPKQ